MDHVVLIATASRSKRPAGPPCRLQIPNIARQMIIAMAVAMEYQDQPFQRGSRQNRHANRKSTTNVELKAMRSHVR